jgi:hypothetical protein
LRGNNVGSREPDGFEDEANGPLGREADADAVGKDVASIGPGPTLGLNSFRKATLNHVISPMSLPNKNDGSHGVDHRGILSSGTIRS